MADCKQCVTFYLDNYFFGVDVLKVQEVIRPQEMTAVPMAPKLISGLNNLRGQIVTAMDLRGRLGLSDRPEDQRPMNVVIQNNNEAVSLLVDEIGDVLEIDSEMYEPPPETLTSAIRETFEGVYKLEDQLMVLLNVEKLLQGDSTSP